MMDWEIYLQNEQENKERELVQPDEPAPTIASDLTLHLPRLGKVSAKVSIKNGRMQIGILADDKASLALLSANQSSLSSAIARHGQQIERLTVRSND